jgi:hypothetical protein
MVFMEKLNYSLIHFSAAVPGVVSGDRFLFAADPGVVSGDCLLFAAVPGVVSGYRFLFAAVPGVVSGDTAITLSGRGAAGIRQ